MRSPLSIDWNQTPDEQAWNYFHAVQSQVYGPSEPRPAWPSDASFQTADGQRQMAAAFDRGAYSWRQAGTPKLLHTHGAVGLFRLVVHGESLGSVLNRGAGRLFIGRYSVGQQTAYAQAKAQEAELATLLLGMGAKPKPVQTKPLILGLALKFPRRRRTPVDLLMLLNKLRIQEVRSAWKHPFSTTIEDPRLTTGLEPEVMAEVRIGTEGLNAVARAVGASPKVQAHSLPLPEGIAADRLTWVHTQRAANLLRTCGNTPFEGELMSPDDTPLVGKMRGKPWARIFVGAPPAEPLTAPPWAEVFLESRLHIGPVGDYWLHFSHPMGHGA